MTLVAFDFDGTLSDSEMTVLLGSKHGVADEMERITQKAMNDEIGYAESLRQRVGLLEGLSASAAQEAFQEVSLRPGAAKLIAALNDAGVYTAILTGGFRRGVEAALTAEGVSVDMILSNTIEITDGTVTGAVSGPLIDGTKDDAITDVTAGEGVDLADTVAVGDGANDLPMLQVAGLAIGFSPKPAVAPHCDVIVEDMAELETLLRDRGVLL